MVREKVGQAVFCYCHNKQVSGEYPARLVASGDGTCDCYSVFSAATAEEINDNFICVQQR